jgi:mannose/fructose-specific phosphotransferase system component IIA
VSEPLRGVVLAHVRLADALVAAAEEISGIHDALVPVTNTGCDRGLLQDRLRQAMGGGPAIVFVDLPNGSCFVAAMRALSERSQVRIVTGVNLAMLLDFLFHRSLTLDEAAERAGQVGTRAIAGSR